MSKVINAQKIKQGKRNWNGTKILIGMTRKIPRHDVSTEKGCPPAPIVRSHVSNFQKPLMALDVLGFSNCAS